MLKRSALRRLSIATLALCLFLVTVFFPDKEVLDLFDGNVEYTTLDKSAIYLVDANNYVSRITIGIKEQNDFLLKAKEIITLLTIDSSKKDYIPNNFHAVIPNGTELLSIDIQDKTLKLNFDKTFLNLPGEQFNDMLESIIYSLTELEEIDSIIIFVDGELLNTKGDAYKNIPTLLTRDFGINKTYDLKNFKNTTKTTAYYVSKTDQFTYYIPVTFVNNETEKDKIEIIIEKLKSSPIHETNLMSYLHASAELLDYEIVENTVKLSFNKYLLDDFYNQEVLEEVKYSVSLSLKDSLHIDSVMFFVDNNEI